MPEVVLPRSGAPMPLVRAGSHGAAPGDGGLLTPAMLSALAASDTDAFLVDHDGRLVVEYCGSPEAATRSHPLWSVTKSVVGALAGILIERGQVDPQAPATVSVPELARGGYAAATVRDLLDMRTGGDFLERYSLTQAGRADLAGTGAPDPAAVSFSYRSADTDVLAWVLEAASGRDLATLLTEELLDPIGTEAAGVLALDANGHPLASGGLALVPSDVARFARMLLDSGSVGDRHVVPARFLKDTTPAPRTRWPPSPPVRARSGRTPPPRRCSSRRRCTATSSGCPSRDGGDCCAWGCTASWCSSTAMRGWPWSSCRSPRTLPRTPPGRAR